MIEINNKPYRCYLIDANVALQLLKDKEGFGSKVLNLVLADGVFVFTATTLWEVSEDTEVFDEFLNVFLTLPSILMRSEDEIIASEREFYFNDTALGINDIGLPFNREFYRAGGTDVVDLVKKMIPLGSCAEYKAKEYRNFVELAKRESVAYLTKDNFSDHQSVKNSIDLLAFEFIAAYEAKFAKELLSRKESLKVERFPSALSKSYLYHYKFARPKRKGEPSDFSDILVSSALPYVDVFLTERGVANSIREIRDLYRFYDDLETMTMKDIRVL